MLHPKTKGEKEELDLRPKVELPKFESQVHENIHHSKKEHSENTLSLLNLNHIS